jgi:hypothetical protein
MTWPYEALDALCADVGIRRTAAFPAGPQVTMDHPADAAFWSGSYAQLAFWPAVEETLADAAAHAQAWIDEALTAAESRDRPVDGYLVIGLPRPPEHEATRAFVRRIELSTLVCRKQVVWPCAASPGGWRGLAAVSVLGFPPAVRVEEVDTMPVLDPEALALWERIEDIGFAKAAERDREGEGP